MWRFIKAQRSAEAPNILWRVCYEIAPEVYVAVRVCWN